MSAPRQHARAARNTSGPADPRQEVALRTLGRPSDPEAPATAPEEPPVPTVGADDEANPTAPPCAEDEGPAEASEVEREEAEASRAEPWRAPIPVEDLRGRPSHAQEAMAAWMWVQRRRAQGFKPC